MKISRKDLEKLISEVMAEQRVPSESTALSEKARRRNRPAGKRQRKRQRRNKWAVRDVDGDGDFDLENVGGKMSPPIHGKGMTASGVKAETGDIIISAGIIDPEGWAALSSDEHFEDPKFGRKTREGTLNKFMMDLAYDIASGDEQRLELDQIRKLADLNPEWSQALDQFDADVADEMRRQEDYDDMYGLNESKETRMSNGFGRNDIKAWFAQTLYEDFETSKPRKRRATGILTEATEDGRDDQVDDYKEYLGMISQALVLGLETLFGLDLDENKERELGEDFKRILEKDPDMTNSIARYFEYYRLGDSLISGDDDGMAAPGVAGSDLERIHELIATEVADTMDAADFVAMPKSELDEIIRLMIRHGALDPMAASANIDVDDIHTRVQEIQGTLHDVLHLVASEVYNSMDSTSLRRDDLKRLIDDMIAAGKFTREEVDASGVNFVDVVEKVEEFEREYGDDPPPRN